MICIIQKNVKTQTCNYIFNDDFGIQNVLGESSTFKTANSNTDINVKNKRYIWEKLDSNCVSREEHQTPYVVKSHCKYMTKCKFFFHQSYIISQGWLDETILQFFFRQVANNKFIFTNLAFLLWSEQGRWFSTKNTTIYILCLDSKMSAKLIEGIVKRNLFQHGVTHELCCSWSDCDSRI